MSHSGGYRIRAHGAVRNRRCRETRRRRSAAGRERPAVDEAGVPCGERGFAALSSLVLFSAVTVWVALLIVKLAVVVGDGVVAEDRRRRERGADDVGSDRLTRRAAVGRRHVVRPHEPDQGARQRRVRRAVALPRGCRCHRGSLLRDLVADRTVRGGVVAGHRR